MTKLLTYTLVSLLFITIGCKRDVFPDQSQLIGSWTELDYTGVEPMKLNFVDQHTLILKESELLPDTLYYTMDPSNDAITISSPSACESSTHNIWFDENKGTLIILGLYVSTPENQSQTEFAKD
jgi:cobalamin biosynthesis Mg chelatase CobN